MPPETAQSLFLFYDHAKRELQFGSETACITKREANIFNALFSCPRKIMSIAELFDAAHLNEGIYDDNISVSVHNINAVMARLTQASGIDYSIKNIRRIGYYFDPTPFAVTKIYEAKKDNIMIRIFDDTFEGPVKDRMLVRLSPANHDRALVLDTNLQRLYYSNRFTPLTVKEFCLAKAIMHKNGQAQNRLQSTSHMKSADVFNSMIYRIRIKTKLLTHDAVRLERTETEGYTTYKFATAKLG